MEPRDGLRPPETPAPAPRKGFWRRHRWLLWVGGAALAVLVALIVAGTIAARHIEPFLRAQIVEGLEERFHTRVELDTFHVQVREGEHAMFGLWATGKGLRIWPPHKAGGDHPLETAVESLPLIDLKEFSFHVPLRWKTAEALKIPQVRLKGLKIDVPPRSARDRGTGLESAMDVEAQKEEKEQAVQEAHDSGPQGGGLLDNVLIQKVLCEQAEVVVETDRPDKLPLTFDIEHLKLTHITAGDAMNFDAELTNAKPKGLVQTSGSFGPWDVTDPGNSPLKGKYSFQHANLADFNGIAGTLASRGTYGGSLRDVKVDGEATVPDFRLTAFGGTLPLHTSFHARVDGTDGDTYLDNVDAVLGNSHFSTAGKIVLLGPGRAPAGEKADGTRSERVGRKPKPSAGTPEAAELPAQTVPAAAGAPGHLIELKVDVPHGDMADFMKLVSKSGTPLMTGTVSTKASLQIPPGKQPVHDRIKLNGFFKLENAHFTSDKVQKKVEDLSYHALGKPDGLKNANPDSVPSAMQGNFQVANGVITLPDLQYQVPGAQILLHGTYTLAGELHLDGTARMQATVSQIVGGWKGFLLKPIDRFFKKGGAGTLVPIKVRGTRDAPDFGMDLGRLGDTHPQRPGGK